MTPKWPQALKCQEYPVYTIYSYRGAHEATATKRLCIYHCVIICKIKLRIKLEIFEKVKQTSQDMMDRNYSGKVDVNRRWVMALTLLCFVLIRAKILIIVPYFSSTADNCPTSVRSLWWMYRLYLWLFLWGSPRAERFGREDCHLWLWRKPNLREQWLCQHMGSEQSN